MVGSYSSTKWLWMNWIVKADLPTPVPWSERPHHAESTRYYTNHHHRRRPTCIPARTGSKETLWAKLPISTIRLKLTLDMTAQKREKVNQGRMERRDKTGSDKVGCLNNREWTNKAKQTTAASRGETETETEMGENGLGCTHSVSDFTIYLFINPVPYTC